MNDFKKRLSFQERQEKFQEEENAKARKTLDSFIERVKLYKKELQEENIAISQETLESKFSPEELDPRKSGLWIKLAIGAVINPPKEQGGRGE